MFRSHSRLDHRPRLDAPARSEDLPGSLLEVLDFAPLVQEFYRRSNIGDLMTAYTRAHQAEGDRLRKPTAEMVNGRLVVSAHTTDDDVVGTRAGNGSG